MARPARIALGSLLWIVLGLWIGGQILFATIVAPTAFRVLPSPELAGALVSPVLAALHLYGVVAGIGLAILAAALRRGTAAIALPLAMTAVCLFSYFGITAELAEIRAEAGARFAFLHRLSVGLFVGVTAATVVLVVLHTRAELDPRG